MRDKILYRAPPAVQCQYDSLEGGGNRFRFILSTIVSLLIDFTAKRLPGFTVLYAILTVPKEPEPSFCVKV